MTTFPHDWHWTIGGDESRYWSSSAAAYVEELPEGAGVTRITSEDELWDVLREQAPSGLPERLNFKRLTRWQWLSVLEVAALMPVVEALIDRIDDQVTRVIVRQRMMGSDYYERLDPLTVELVDAAIVMPDSPLTIPQVNDLWRMAETFS